MNLKLDGRQKTILLGELFGDCIRNINESCVIALQGTLGAGKTTFVKGLAKGLGVKEVVQSPTFTMLNEYHSGSLPLYHLDLYRLSESSQDQARSLGDQLVMELEEFINGRMVCVIEWSELFKLINPNEKSYLDHLDHSIIRFAYDTEELMPVDDCDHELEVGRTVAFASCGAASQRLLDKVVEAFNTKVAE